MHHDTATLLNLLLLYSAPLLLYASATLSLFGPTPRLLYHSTSLLLQLLTTLVIHSCTCPVLLFSDTLKRQNDYTTAWLYFYTSNLVHPYTIQLY